MILNHSEPLRGRPEKYIISFAACDRGEYQSQGKKKRCDGSSQAAKSVMSCLSAVQIGVRLLWPCASLQGVNLQERE